METLPWFHDLNIRRLVPPTESHALGVIHTPVIIAYSFTTPQVIKVAEEVRLLRKSYGSDITLIAGGPHPTGDPYQTIKLGFDVIILGEGEQSFVKVIQAIKEGNPFEMANIPGIVWKENDTYHKTKPAPPIDLNQHPSYSTTNHLYPPIELTRGCPYSCAYCQVPRLHPKIRHRSLERVLDIVHVYRKVFDKNGKNPTAIRFISPNALAFGNSSPRRGYGAIEQLLKEISSLPRTQVFFASFPSEVRPEYLTEEAADLIKRYSTNDEIVVGGQSANNELLEKIRRGHTAETIYSAVEIANQYHLTPLVDIILGLPSETFDIQKQTIEMIEQLIDKGAIPRIHHFIPLAGTPYYTEHPADVHIEHRKRIGQLMQAGKVRGSFEYQRKLALSVVKFLQTWKIQIRS